MTALNKTRQILEELNSKNITLSVGKGLLRYKAPAGTMTDGLKIELKAHKQEIIEELSLPLPRPIICPSCSGVDWWLSIHDKYICTVCHPPANERLVKKRNT